MLKEHPSVQALTRFFSSLDPGEVQEKSAVNLGSKT